MTTKRKWRKVAEEYKKTFPLIRFDEVVANFDPQENDWWLCAGGRPIAVIPKTGLGGNEAQERMANLIRAMFRSL